jgi:hypothetical protein
MTDFLYSLRGVERTVTVNVYDLPGAEQSNEWLYSIGLGFYHTGVEISSGTATGDAYEYFFSMMGIQRSRPRLPIFGRLRTQIKLGAFAGNQSDINTAVNNLSRGAFAPGLYHISTRNCNHFSEAFIHALMGAPFPSWINRAANVGSVFIPGPTTGPPPVESATSAVDTGSTNATPDSNSSNHSGLGGSIAGFFGFGGSAASENEKSLATTSTATEPVKTKSDEKKQLTDKQKQLLANLKKS